LPAALELLPASGGGGGGEGGGGAAIRKAGTTLSSLLRSIRKDKTVDASLGGRAPSSSGVGTSSIDVGKPTS